MNYLNMTETELYKEVLNEMNLSKKQNHFGIIYLKTI